jgi:hypothetical protein
MLQDDSDGGNDSKEEAVENPKLFYQHIPVIGRTPIRKFNFSGVIDNHPCKYSVLCG